MTTLDEAKMFILINREKGIKCPCCNQFVKLYKRKLNSGMAITLIRMYNHNKFGWISVKDFLRRYSLKNNHDWTLLRHWTLIEEKPENPEHGGKTNGVWRLTDLGRRFVERKINVMERLLIYNNTFMGFEGTRININYALGDKFDYDELMKV